MAPTIVQPLSPVDGSVNVSYVYREPYSTRLRVTRLRPLLRPKAQGAQLKAGVAPRAAAPASAAGGDTNKARSPGLRRRDLLGGAEDIQLQAKVAAASAAPSPAPAATTSAAAGEGPALSVVSLSATNRFRARRELER